MKQARTSMIVVGVSALVLCAGGCQRDPRVGDRKIRSPKVRTVTHYGVTLDQDASPKQVAFVLLRSLRDDFLSRDEDARERALDVTFDVCAATVLGATNATSFTDDEFIHQLVFRWAPTVGYYVGDLDLDWPEAEQRLKTAIAQPLKLRGTEYQATNVLIVLAAPSGRPTEQVVLIVRLVQDQGYWRVLKLEYEQTRRSIAAGS